MTLSADFKFSFDAPIVATSIHNGHLLSKPIKDNIAINQETQLREEDPFTEHFTSIVNNRIIVHTSRFQVDLNRSRDKCFYQKPEDAWGLNVRKEKLPNFVAEKCRTSYDEFYSSVREYFEKMEEKFGKFIVLDIHSFNHKRDGIDSPPADPEKIPDIIIGTSNMPSMWNDLIDDFQKKLEEQSYFGRNLKVGRNIRFPGGAFPRWIHDNFPDSACCIAIEFKKIFMCEWTSLLDLSALRSLREALSSTLPLLMKYQQNLTTKANGQKRKNQYQRV